MISVCLATYNGEKYLCEQIDSILSQLEDSDELIISDDDSTDSTIEILNSYNDRRIRILHNSYNHGVNGNFENALRNAQGDYIFLSDQDDVWLPNKVRVCVKALESSDCIVHDAIVVDGHQNIKSKSLFEDLHANTGFFKNLEKNTFTGCCMVFSKKVLDRVLPFPKSSLFYHDQWIGLIASLSYRVSFLSEPLIYFRRHSTNTSSAGKKSNLDFKSKLLSRLSLVKAILIQYYKS